MTERDPLIDAVVNRGKTSTDHATFAVAMDHLFRCSDQFEEWSFEYPGFAALRVEGGGLWIIGTANGTWAADFYADADDYTDGVPPNHTVDTKLAATVTDGQQIGQALYDAMLAEWRALDAAARTAAATLDEVLADVPPITDEEEEKW